MADAENNGFGGCNIVMGIGNSGVLVCSVGAGCTCVYPKFSLEAGDYRLVAVATGVTGRTSKTRRILLKSKFQATIASLSSFAW